MKNAMYLSRNHRIKSALLKISNRIDEVCHASNKIAPPDYLSFQYGGGSFFEIGLHFFRLLLDHCNLHRHSQVLDVGCGIGRMAMPLTAYLAPQARYEGFDIMPDGVDYCARHLTPLFPIFNFQIADVFNSFYNPQGTARVENYRFPFPDASFDVVFSTSVFTHLPPAGVDRYIQETARVLRPGGKCLHTCFMLNAESRAGIEKGLDPYGFKYTVDNFVTNNLKNIEDAIAMPEEMFVDLYQKAGLAQLSRYYGSWSGRGGDCLSHQDICVATKA